MAVLSSGNLSPEELLRKLGVFYMGKSRLKGTGGLFANIRREVPQKSLIASENYREKGFSPRFTTDLLEISS
jgi:hypothetical protein